MIAPLTPQEAVAAKTTTIPEEVFDVFNTLIARNVRGGHHYVTATVQQDDVLALLAEKGITRQQAFDNKWLDVEESYRAAGWEVVYDKPGYNETGRAFFRFSTPRPRFFHSSSERLLT